MLPLLGALLALLVVLACALLLLDGSWIARAAVPLAAPTRTPVNASLPLGEPREAFIAFVTKSHTELLPAWLDSLHEFSTRPIVVYGVDHVPELDVKKYPRLLLRRVTGAAHSVYFNKPLICLHALSEFDRVAYVEPDAVVNYRVDDLFAILAHAGPLPYPLLPRHPTDPDNQRNCMARLGVEKKTLAYGHAHLLFTRAAAGFFADVLAYAQQGLCTDANVDETLINTVLWKASCLLFVCLFVLFRCDCGWRCCGLCACVNERFDAAAMIDTALRLTGILIAMYCHFELRFDFVVGTF